MNEEARPAAVAVGRSLTYGGTVWIVGARPPRPRWVAVAAHGAEAALRERAGAGDTIIVVGDLGDPVVRDRILRRGPAWGAAALWIGAGPAPEAGLAQVRLPATDPDEALELLARVADDLAGDHEALAPALADCTDEVCVTCSDEGRIGEVVDPPAGLFLPALVRTASGLEEVDVTLVGDLEPHDLVVIHAGGAIARLDERAPLTEVIA